MGWRTCLKLDFIFSARHVRSSFVSLIGCCATENAVTKATKFLKSIDWKREDIQKKVTAAAFGAVGVGLCYLAWKSKRSVSGAAGDDAAAAATEVRGFCSFNFYFSLALQFVYNSIFMQSQKPPNPMPQNKQNSKASLKKQKEKSSKKTASKARSSHRKKTGGGKDSTSSPAKPKKKASSKSGATAGTLRSIFVRVCVSRLIWV